MKYKTLIIATIMLIIFITHATVVYLQIDSLRQSVLENIKKDMNQNAIDYANKLDAYLVQVSQVAKTTASMLSNIPDISIDQMYEQLRSNTLQSTLIYGAGMCFEPYSFSPQTRLLCPYVFRDRTTLDNTDNSKEALKSIDIANQYDYTQPQWEYWEPVRQTGKDIWTDPYFDEGAGNIFMTTFSTPFFKDGKFRGITTVDIPLEHLHNLLDLGMLAHINFTLITQNGTIVYSPDLKQIGNSFFNFAKSKKRDDMLELFKYVVSGKEGLVEMPALDSDKQSLFFYAPVKSANWGLFIQIDKEIALTGLNKEIYWYLILSLIGLFILILFFVIFIYFLHLQNKLEKTKLLINQLTNLPNINALKIKDNDNDNFVFLYIDIEFFSTYNRLYGHEIGDNILKKMAIILKSYAIKHNYKVFHIGGDNFGLLIPETSDLDNKAKKCLNYIQNNSIDINGVDITLTVKIGVSTNQISLLEDSHQAVRVAKSKGLHYFIYNKEETSHKHNVEKLTSLIKAIKENDILTYYQPIVDANAKIVKYEALVRMNDNGNILSPFEFLDIAKTSGHYFDITNIVCKQVIKDVERYNIKASINLAYEDISDEHHITTIFNMLSRMKNPSNITLEILESSAIDNFTILKDFTEKAKKIGVKIAIDDYGSGYSSLQNIIEIQPDILKIDGSIVKYINDNPRAFIVTQATTKGGHDLGMKIVAEFISTKEIFETTKNMGIDMYQGYYFSEPKPLSAFIKG